ncbi:MAG: hypothetical protein AB1631_30625 [Acidobacteriota bacterium]
MANVKHAEAKVINLLGDHALAHLSVSGGQVWNLPIPNDITPDGIGKDDTLHVIVVRGPISQAVELEVAALLGDLRVKEIEKEEGAE